MRACTQLLPDDLITSPLFYEWGADSQKLYYWLRRRVCRGEPTCPAEARAWHSRGYLCVHTTAEVLRREAVPVSKNTLTKLVQELRDRRLVQTRTAGRGYLFLLGEWLRRRSPDTGQELYFEAFYLDAVLTGQPPTT